MPKHPYTSDKPKLVIESSSNGYLAFSVRNARYKRGSGYEVREHIATIRVLTTDLLGMDDDPRGKWSVLRGAFDDIRSFPTRDEAFAYVEAIFALESQN